MKIFDNTSAVIYTTTVMTVFFLVNYPMHAEGSKDSAYMTDTAVNVEPNSGWSKQLVHLEETIPELSGLSSRWEQLEGWDSFREIVPQLYNYYDSDLEEEITTTIEQFDQLPWKPQTATIKKISKEIIGHFYFVHRIKSYADSKRESNQATLLKFPEFGGTEFFATCMDAAEVKHQENTAETFALIADEMTRVYHRYSKYHVEGIEFDLSSDLSLEIKTIGSHISKNLIAGQQGFSGEWRECNNEFRKTYHPILEENFLTYVRDLADYLDYAIEKSEDFDVGQKYQAIDADEFEKFRQERQEQ